MKQIEVKKLSVSYGNFGVLCDIDFTVEKGEFIVIVGKSGSGKTTFLHALADLIPFSGEIDIPENKGVVFQHYAVFPWLTVSENIAFGLDRYSEEKQREVTSEHLRIAQLEGKDDSYPAELSGGQVQRVALARSLAHSPELLLMDEPYGSLDAYTRDQMQEWLLGVWSEHKKTIVFVTHSIEEAIFLADRILVLSNKHFIEELKVPFGRPRKEEIKFTPEFNQLRKNIFESIS
ncbi:MAG: ABC transporter ATP-binding protein [Patescibacteria group bacterium]|jgi:NitT/TauT family transport system ATP-binding protein